MRKVFVVFAAATAMVWMSPASQAATATMEAKIVKGNGDVASVRVQPELPGKWTFVADVSGSVNDVALQLYLVNDRGSCNGSQVGAENLGDQNLKWNKRSVAAGQYTVTFESDSVAEHCARVILWGSPGASASVTVSSPVAPSPGGVLPGLKA